MNLMDMYKWGLQDHKCIIWGREWVLNYIGLGGRYLQKKKAFGWNKRPLLVAYIAFIAVMQAYKSKHQMENAIPDYYCLVKYSFLNTCWFI